MENSKNYYLKQFELFDGEEYITFNIVDINFDKKVIVVAITNRGKISVLDYDLFADCNGDFYFNYGYERTKIEINDFED